MQGRGAARICPVAEHGRLWTVSFHVRLLKLRSKNLSYNSPLRWTKLMLQSDASGDFSSVQHFHFNAILRAGEPVWSSSLHAPLLRTSVKDNYHPTWQGMYHHWRKILRWIQTSATVSGNIFLPGFKSPIETHCFSYCLLRVWRIHPVFCGQWKLDEVMS